MIATHEVQAEFSRPVPIERLERAEFTEEISAAPEERAALARRFGLLSLDRLCATLRLERAEGEGLALVTGRFVAEVTQACVVTLEPVASRIEADMTLLFNLETAPAAAPGGEVVVEPEAEEPPEPAGSSGIDLGEAVAQQLALALDPYPRALGAVLPESAEAGTPGETAAESPFAVLKSLKPEK